MSNRPFFSVIMPTYNSGNTIERSLSSLCEQTIYPSDVELLVIDGGSIDSTLEIAKKAGARIISNPDRVPESAKLIGINESAGRYIVEMDSDEILTSKTQFENRKKALMQHPDTCVLITKELLPLKENGFYSAYSTLLGDPFSFFIYRCCGDYVKAYGNNIVSSDNGIYSFSFSEEDTKPIADGGTTTISMDYIRTHLSNRMKETSFAATVAAEVIQKTGKMICLDDDKVIHNNPMSRQSYLKKLRFRIINNIFEAEKSGFSSRTKNTSTPKNKKYLYIPYCLFLFPVLFDSLMLCFRLRNLRYIEHFVLSLYVLFMIGGYMILKCLGIKHSNTSYGK